MDEHRRGLAQATLRLCRILGGKGQGPHPGPSSCGHHCGGCRDRGCAGSRAFVSLCLMRGPGPEDGLSAWFLCDVPACTYYQEKE